MTETGQTFTGEQKQRSTIDAFCDGLRDGLHSLADSITPPATATRHFHQARIEFLSGIREMIDHRIDRLSRQHNRGTTVPVE